jgi:pilus assembly protein CpaD
VIKEGDRTVDLLIGRARGALTPAQRADLTSFALKWARESTGGIIVAVPSGAPNARAAHEAVPEIRAVLAHSGVPAQAVRVQSYPVNNPALLATVRVSYPKMAAQAGPCGMWPQDLGPTYDNKTYMANQPYWNLGCANQRNLAAMVDDPADLVQPRGETPIYAARRTMVLEKYRSGNSPATVYTNANDGKISDVGK